MNSPLRDYARVGLVHHLLYPRCMADPADHVNTLSRFVRRDDIETLDCCIPYGQAHRDAVIPVVRNCGKEVVYAMHLFPLRKISLASTDPQEQGLIRLVVDDQIALAVAVGATGFVFASGADVPEERRPAAKQAFAEFCRWFCLRLKPRGITALLEPFDRTIDKKFLYGPSAECIELIRSLAPEVDNLKIGLDLAHVPLMGESFAQAIQTTAPFLQRIHLGNCVLRDTAHPWYGDQHPPMGLAGGEIDVEQLTEILRLLLQVEYLSPTRRGALVIEMQPFPDKTPEQTIADNLDRLHRAWAEV